MHGDEEDRTARIYHGELYLYEVWGTMARRLLSPHRLASRSSLYILWWLFYLACILRAIIHDVIEHGTIAEFMAYLVTPAGLRLGIRPASQRRACCTQGCDGRIKVKEEEERKRIAPLPTGEERKTASPSAETEAQQEAAEREVEDESGAPRRQRRLPR